jgi:hypothetical protein
MLVPQLELCGEVLPGPDVPGPQRYRSQNDCAPHQDAKVGSIPIGPGIRVSHVPHLGRVTVAPG